MGSHRLILLIPLLITLGSPAIKTLSTSCFCDVSTSCDAYCCCDTDCSSSLIYNWNNFTLCASDGYAIPLCTAYYKQPMHSHDLYQGLRMIYTIVKRLFCISKINFVDPAKGFTSSTTDAQISIPSSVVSATPGLDSLTSISTYGNLPLRNGMGVCGQYVLKDMNNIFEGECRVYLASSSQLGSDPYLSISQLTGNNGITLSSLSIYSMTSASVAALTPTSLSSSCVGSTCMMVKQIQLFFIKSGASVTVDYSSSYVVMGNTVISGPTYVYLRYGYQFISQVGNFPYSSSIGYAKGSLLSLVKSVPNGTSSTKYYKIFNPVNLAFINTDGSCRSAASSDADHSNLISFRFGVNSIYTCLGTSSIFAYNNLKQAFDMVGSIGSASTSLTDFVTVENPAIISNNQNLQLLFYYASVGTQASPQYQITKAVLNPVAPTGNGQFTLFVEYVPISNSVVLNLPSPPVIDAYLPDDFLYPFYVA